jgi:hypothetical protein
VKFDAVESRFTGVARRLRKGLDNRRNLLDAKRARRRKTNPARRQEKSPVAGIANGAAGGSPPRMSGPVFS